MQHLVTTSFKAALLAAAVTCGVAPAQSAPMPPTAGNEPAALATAPVSGSGYLGVYLEGAADGGGVRLAEIVGDSPAAKAGLKAGDVIVAIGDRTTASEEELRSAIAGFGAGAKVKITFLRDGEKRRTSARLATAPTEAAESEEQAVVADLVDVTEEGTGSGVGGAQVRFLEVAPSAAVGGSGGGGWLGVQLSPTDDGNASVLSVVDGSPAAGAGLQAGDVIVRVDGDEIGSVDGLVKAIGSRAAGEKVRLVLNRGGEEKKLKVTLGARSGAMAGLPGGALVMEVPAAELPTAPPAVSAPLRRARIAAAPPGMSGAGGGDVNAARAEIDALRRQVEELRARCEKQQQQLDAIRSALGGGGGGREPEPTPESAPHSVAFALAGPGEGGAPDYVIQSEGGSFATADGTLLQLQSSWEPSSEGGLPRLAPLTFESVAGEAACQAGSCAAGEGDGMTLTLHVDADGTVSTAACDAGGGEGTCTATTDAAGRFQVVFDGVANQGVAAGECPVIEGENEFQIVLDGAGGMAGASDFVHTHEGAFELVQATGGDGVWALVRQGEGGAATTKATRVKVAEPNSGAVQLRLWGGDEAAWIETEELPAEFGKGDGGQKKRVAVKTKAAKAPRAVKGIRVAPQPAATDCGESCCSKCDGCPAQTSAPKAKKSGKAKAKAVAPKFSFSTRVPAVERQVIVVTPDGGHAPKVLHHGTHATPGFRLHGLNRLPGHAGAHGLHGLRLRRLGGMHGMHGMQGMMGMPAIRFHGLGGNAGSCPAMQTDCSSCCSEGSGDACGAACSDGAPNCETACAGGSCAAGTAMFSIGDGAWQVGSGAGECELMTIDLGEGAMFVTDPGACAEFECVEFECAEGECEIEVIELECCEGDGECAEACIEERGDR